MVSFLLVLLGAISAFITLVLLQARFGGFLKGRRWDLPTDHLGRRLWNTINEVLLQRRVIANRPVVGVLHALVMIGFLTFIGVSIQHLLSGLTGFWYIPENGMYRTSVTVWAVLVLVGIFGLAYRRFIRRPRILGPVSTSSGIVTGLIVILMVTYLVDWLGVFPVRSTAWQVVWWLHTLALVGFPPVIAHSKHLHLVLAPIAIFFRPEQDGRMRRLDMEHEDFGLEKVGQLTVGNILRLNACVECGRCTEVCPVNRSGSTLSPREVVLGIQHELQAKDTEIIGPQVSENDIMSCTTCKACTDVCPCGVDPLGFIIDLRHGIVNNEKLTLKRVREKAFVPMKNPPYSPWAFTEPRSKFIEQEKFPLYQKGMGMLLWLGCGVIGTNNTNIAVAMRKHLDFLGESWGVLEQEPCCGEVAYQLGDVAKTTEISANLVEIFKNLDIHTVIVCDPHCTNMLKFDHRIQDGAYADLNITVLHHTEFLVANIERFQFTQTEGTVVFHDPCRLGRGLGVINQPRDLLCAIGMQVVEASESKERSLCCGAGGGQSLVFDETLPKELRMNYTRYDQLKATGAPLIAAACPHCPIMLKEAADHRGDAVNIKDIAEITAERLPEKEVTS